MTVNQKELNDSFVARSTEVAAATVVIDGQVFPTLILQFEIPNREKPIGISLVLDENLAREIRRSMVANVDAAMSAAKARQKRINRGDEEVSPDGDVQRYDETGEHTPAVTMGESDEGETAAAES